MSGQRSTPGPREGSRPVSTEGQSYRPRASRGVTASWGLPPSANPPSDAATCSCHSLTPDQNLPATFSPSRTGRARRPGLMAAGQLVPVPGSNSW